MTEQETKQNIQNAIKNFENNKIDIAVENIKNAILQSQYAAGKLVNAQQLSLYYGIGEYVSTNSRAETWGTGAIESISERLQKQMPGLRGFSAENIKKMRRFYEEWHPVLNSVATATELLSDKTTTMTDETENQKANTVINAGRLIEKAENKINQEEFLSISFSHHMEILNKTKTLEERKFYIHQTYDNKWSKYTLRDYLKDDLYNHQGKLPNNFSKNISNPQLALKAINMFKDEYFLDYLNTEELNARDILDVDERVVENAIIHNIKNFLMTFGKDFTFVGNQYHLEIFEEDHFSDLLFFNRELNCLVVVELKTGKFKSAYLGQLCTYLRILDDKIKKPHENPSIGIILCREANKDYVEYVIQDYDKPMGVATYKTSKDMDEKFKKALPPIEDLQKILSNEKGVGYANK